MSACREAEFLVLLWGSARNKTELEAVCRPGLLPKVNTQDSPEVGKWPIVLDLLHAMEADSWLHTADFGFDQSVLMRGRALDSSCAEIINQCSEFSANLINVPPHTRL